MALINRLAIISEDNWSLALDFNLKFRSIFNLKAGIFNPYCLYIRTKEAEVYNSSIKLDSYLAKYWSRFEDKGRKSLFFSLLTKLGWYLGIFWRKSSTSKSFIVQIMLIFSLF